MGKSKSSHRWLREHFDDPYVKQAQALGYRSRAAFKLIELQEKYKLIKNGMNVVDLGAAPGGWSQMAVKWVGEKGRVVGLDILEIEPLAGVTLIQGDFTEQEPLDELQSVLGEQPVDLVLSDMAPNISGINASDQAKAMYLVELALDFCRSHLKAGGTFLAKAFQGQGFEEWLAETRAAFQKTQIVKPKASRPRSREVYVLARGKRS